MKKYYSIIAINKDNKIIDFINNINNQTINSEEIEIIIETTKLPTSIKQSINNKNVIIREHKNYDISKMYNDGLKIASGKYINFTNTTVLYQKDTTLNKIKELNKYNIITTSIIFNNTITNNVSKYIFSNEVNELIDLKKDKENINLSLESYFVNHKLLKNISFDTKFGIESPIKLIIDIFNKNSKRYNPNLEKCSPVL